MTASSVSQSNLQQDSARMSGTREARWVAYAMLGSGVLTGASHLPGWWACGYLGIALLAIALDAPCRARDALWGIFGSGAIALWIAHPWQAYSPGAYFPGLLATLEIIVGFSVVNLVPQKLPLFVAWRLLGAGRLPAAVWLPAAWLLGERCLGLVTQMSYTDWLYGQWQCRPVVNLAAHLGGVGASFVCLSLASLAGTACARRSWRLGVLSACTGLALCALPPRHLPVPGWLSTIGAVHMDSYLHPPRSAPKGITTMIWPEQANGQLPYLTEGAGHGQRVRPPFASRDVYHLYGLVTRMADGRRQNMLLSITPDGQVVQSRAKQLLFPIFERPFFGLGGPGFVPGKATPVLPIHGHRAAAVLCCEELDAGFVNAAARDGADFVAVCAIDKVLCGSLLAEQQFLGVSVFLAAETGLPLVRSSLYAGAAFVGPDGQVLAFVPPTHDGVLTLAGDFPVDASVKP